MNLQAIFVANGSAILLLFILLLSSKKTIQSRLPDNQLFFLMVYSTILQCTLETTAFLIDGMPGVGMHICALAVNSACFINNISFSLIWTLFADYKLFSDMNRIRRLYPFVAIPAALVIIGSIINLFTPVFFTISDTNVYSRSGIFLLAYIITYLYLAYGVILIYSNKNRSNHYLFLPALLFMIPIMICSLLQLVFYGLSLVWIGAAIALVSMYINVQNEVSYIDTLSGSFTRQYMNRFLESETRRTGQSRPVSGIMLDIDRFKTINDRFGHLTGDDAIRSAGAILHNCIPSPGFVVRFAGDEFVIILPTYDDKQTALAMQKIAASTAKFNAESGKPYQLEFSMGHSVFDRQNDTVDSFINRIDRAMYGEKKPKHLHDGDSN